MTRLGALVAGLCVGVVMLLALLVVDAISSQPAHCPLYTADCPAASTTVAP